MVQPLLGKNVRHHRKKGGLTLDALSSKVARPASYLSQLENGKIDPRSSLIEQLARIFGCSVDDLTSQQPATRRDELELFIASAQTDARFASLNLPYFKPATRTPDAVLEHMAALYGALGEADQRASVSQGDDQRTANLSLRDEMRQKNNYFANIEAEAGRALRGSGYEGTGPVTEGKLAEIAEFYGFKISRVRDLPNSARSVTDQRNRTIYIPQRDVLTSRPARSVVLQTLGHFVLGHRDPQNFAEYVRQRVESNYFAAAILAPEEPAVKFLRDAYDRQDLSPADLREAFFLSFEMAAHRMTNLATEHLDLTLHFMRSDEEGVVWKAYENDDVPLPTAADGTFEGQRLCRQWGTRQAFEAEDGYDLHYQWTSTSKGDFWCVTFVESDRRPMHAITVGTDAKQAKYFRGSDTEFQMTSQCPDPSCCREPDGRQRERWRGVAWPSARDRSHVLSGLPGARPAFDKFPGVDMVDVFNFLDRHVQ